MPIVDRIRHDHAVHIEVAPLPVVQAQIVHQQVDQVVEADLLAAHELRAAVAQRTGEHVEAAPVDDEISTRTRPLRIVERRRYSQIAAVQRIDQRIGALLVEPLGAARALQHLHVPLAAAAAVAVRVLGVLAVLFVPGEVGQLEIGRGDMFSDQRYNIQINGFLRLSYHNNTKKRQNDLNTKNRFLSTI